MSWSHAPHFLVIGAGRAGTTSLHHYLGQHPRIFLPRVKAPSYWYAAGVPDAMASTLPASFVRDAAAYDALFADSPPGHVRGEVSPVYLASTAVAPRVAAALPGIRVVAMLRHPVDRVYARWVARRRDGLEPTATFEALIAQEREQPLVRPDAHATYLAGGMVSHVLRTWYDAIPSDQRLVLWFDDFARDSAASMRSVCRFLGVDETAPIDTSRSHNRSGGRIRNPLVRAAWSASYPLRRGLRPFVPQPLRDRAFQLATKQVDRLPMSPDTRAQLTELYRDEIRALSNLTGRDLSSWLDRPDRAV
jgi:Sulfotransferase family